LTDEEDVEIPLIDTGQPHSARVYDYQCHLDKKKLDNFPHLHRSTRPGSVDYTIFWRRCFPCGLISVIFAAVNGEIPAGDRLTDKIGIGVLTRLISRDMVDEVLAETGRREKRSRLLPAHVVVYFVIAMAVFRDGYEEVMRRMVGGLQFMRAWRQEWSVPTTGAISQARERLGEAPLKVLYGKIAEPLATPGTPGAWLGSRRLMAIDGVKLDVPDTPANIEEFGRPGGLTRRPFPRSR
jgi:transposase IS4-like protein